MNFGALRVLNDDTIAPKMGFGKHPHDNMEIITIPLSGVLKHRDSMHNEWQEVNVGEVQIMSAGQGVQHSEINGSNDAYLSLFQIWIVPNKRNVEARYGQKHFSASERKNKLQTLVTSIDEDTSSALQIHQDAKLSRLDLDREKTLDYSLKSENHGVYILVISGDITVGEHKLETRDAIGISEVKDFSIAAHQETELLLIEVPMN